jgi:hypothetical protein
MYGGEAGFEQELSDVDFVVDRLSFQNLPALIYAYCIQANWQLCQVLRHETTAAYFVCSASDDPSCAVALDACSDYQRNGVCFIKAEEFLKARRTLPWGGYGLSPEVQLQYRFTKAAAKGKDHSATEREFAGCPQVAREALVAWLRNKWKLNVGGSAPEQLKHALKGFKQKTRSRPSLLQPGSITRIIDRIAHPTGLVVVLGSHDFENRSHDLAAIYSHLYFRRVQIERHFKLSHLRSLIASTLVIVPELGILAPLPLPIGCLLRLDDVTLGRRSPPSSENISTFLHNRLARRIPSLPISKPAT